MVCHGWYCQVPISNDPLKARRLRERSILSLLSYLLFKTNDADREVILDSALSSFGLILRCADIERSSRAEDVLVEVDVILRLLLGCETGGN